jgi:hypothetical protein
MTVELSASTSPGAAQVWAAGAAGLPHHERFQGPTFSRSQPC